MNPTRIARNVSTVAVASIAAWSSWSHMVHVALRFGKRPEVASVMPDLGRRDAHSRVHRDDRRPVCRAARGRFPRRCYGQHCANITAAQPALGARIVAAWLAVALLMVVEILSRARPEPGNSPPPTLQRQPDGYPGPRRAGIYLGDVRVISDAVRDAATGPGRTSTATRWEHGGGRAADKDRTAGHQHSRHRGIARGYRSACPPTLDDQSFRSRCAIPSRSPPASLRCLGSGSPRGSPPTRGPAGFPARRAG